MIRVLAAGMERLQLTLERVRIRRRQGSAHNTEQTLETGRSHVQQVTCIALR